MQPTIKQFRYFIVAAELGQLSRAAAQINVSQSAITAAIKALEKMVGTPLFDRHPSGVTLTYEGTLFLEHARHIIQSVEEAVRSPQRVRDDVRGPIRLAVTYTVAGYFLPPLLSRFTRAFPNVTLTMTESDRPSIEEGLIGGAFDLAVMLTSNIVNHDGVSYEVLLRSRRRLWVDAHHPLLGQENVSLREVATLPYIMLTVDEASNTAQRYWNGTQYRPNTMFRTSSVEAVRSMVANGTGVAILTDMVHRPYSLEGRRVETVEVSDPIPTMDVGLARATDSSRSATVGAFMEFMRISISAERSLIGLKSETFGKG